jgi:DNA-binding transcriptional MocR family regulator
MSVSVHTYVTGDTSVKIAASLEAAIRSGRLGGGERLPTVRALAAALGRSPATVSAAYTSLRARGLLTSDGRRGTFVSPRAKPARRAEPALPAQVCDLRSGNPDPGLLPDHRRGLAKIDSRVRLYGEDLRYPPLLELARKGFAADGIDATHLSVMAGALDGIERVLRLHLGPGDRVAVEDPGYFAVFDLLAGLGMPLVPIRIDDFGLDPDDLASALERGARALIYTPRAQNPTGAALDPRRARALRAVLSRHPGVLIVEDDHAGPVAGPAGHTLCTRRQRWAVVRSVSKTLGPDLRVSLMTGDEETMRRVDEQQMLGVRWVSHILQRLVAEILSWPSTSRLLIRAEQRYRDRRNALVEALREHGIPAHGRSGLNVWIPVPEEAGIIGGLLDRDWAVAAGERFRLRTGPAIRVTISTLGRAQARSFAGDLADLLAPTRRAAPA